MKPAFSAMVAYTYRGWVPIPLYAAPGGICNCKDGPSCSRSGKHARVAWREVTEPADEVQIRAWAQRYPESNVGVLCGPSRLFVVDLDGPEAIATWQHWLDKHGKAPTLTSRTRRGYHLWYRQPGSEPLPNSASSLAPGIDTRGDGGLIVAPPSVHPSGHGYCWCAGPSQPAPCPAWLEELARPASSPKLPARGAAAPLPQVTGRRHAYVFRAVEGEVQRVLDAAEGTRNHTLNRAAYALGQLVGDGLLDEDAATGALLTAAGAAGLPDAEAAATIRSGLRAGTRNPRSQSA